MVDVTIEGDRALFNVEGTHKLWSFRSRIDIPLTHITGVDADPPMLAAAKSSGLLEQVIRSHLEPFYRSAAVTKLLA